MFSTLPEQIKRMNKNFEGISESIDDSGDLHDSESNNSKDNTRSLDGQIAELTATTQATNASNLLEDIALDLSASENTGPEVSEALSKIINSLLKEKLPEDKVQSKIDSYLRPNNVASLRTPLVNHLIWHQTSAASGTQDSKRQKTQNNLVAGMIAVVKATDLVWKSELQNNKELVKLMTEAMALTTQSHRDLNTARRWAMKNDLNKGYVAQCSSSSVDLEIYQSWPRTLQTPTNSLGKCVPQPHRLLTAATDPAVVERNPMELRIRFNPYKGRNDFLSKGNPPKSRRKEGLPTKQ